MSPVLWTVDLPIIGKFTFTAYFSLLTVGFALAMLLMWRECKRTNVNPDRFFDLCLWVILSSIIGSRILHVVADGHLMEYINYCIAPEKVRITEGMPTSCTHNAQCGDFFMCFKPEGYCHAPRDCLRALKIWQGGLVYYGGFLGALLFSVYYIHKHKLPLWRVADLFGFGTGLGLFWGRMGCFLNGCCYGKVTHGPLGWVFPKPSPTWRHHLEAGLVKASDTHPLPVYPTQLFSALLNLGIFFVCYYWIRPRRRFDGQVFWWFVILKAVTRAVVELFRDDDRGSVLLLSTSQFVSLLLFIVAVFGLRYCKRISGPSYRGIRNH